MTHLIKWKIHSLTQGYKRKIDHTAEVIHKAAAIGPFAISWSAGKDSTAMCHLIKSLYPDTSIIVQFDDCDWPEKRPYTERVARAQGWEYHAVEPPFSVWEEACRGRIGQDDFCSPDHYLTKNGFLRLLEEKREHLGCVGSYMGLRAQESRGRKINSITNGELYRVKSGVWHCCPIARWTVDDVFAYLVANDVEINPCYFNNALRQPEEIRLAWALPTATENIFADMEHIRRYYPAQYRRLRSEGVV